MLVWAVWCYPDTCLELLKVIWSWAVFPDVSPRLLGLLCCNMYSTIYSCIAVGCSSCIHSQLYPIRNVSGISCEIGMANYPKMATEPQEASTEYISLAFSKHTLTGCIQIVML